VLTSGIEPILRTAASISAPARCGAAQVEHHGHRVTAVAVKTIVISRPSSASPSVLPSPYAYPRGAYRIEEMYGIHFLTSRTSDHPVETMKSGPRFTDAVADAKSQFAGVKIRNQNVIDFMIRDNGGYEVTRWYAEAAHLSDRL
jgi:hypothetical protein